jgi:hypothetical protein
MGIIWGEGTGFQEAFGTVEEYGFSNPPGPETPLQVFWWSMIFSENRRPLFRIML